MRAQAKSFHNPPPQVALMGPSGSGKTTLLDILSARKTVGEIEGEILMGGHKPTRTYLRRFTGYVEQFGERLVVYEVSIGGGVGWLFFLY